MTDHIVHAMNDMIASGDRQNMKEDVEDIALSYDGNSTEDQITLGLLTSVHADANLSQRSIAKNLGVALGLANAYLKRCVRKGYIKVQQVPRRRYAYYLTPQGFAEKSRLAGEYLTSSLQFFRRARQQMSELLDTCASCGWNRVALIGVSELAEITTLCVHGREVVLVGVVELTEISASYSGLPVVADPADLPPFDAAILTAMHTHKAYLDILLNILPKERILVPRLLRHALPASISEQTAPHQEPLP